jgi:hypothetical protein
MARYDGTLRNARGCIMQFLYGEDGMDAQRIEKQSLHLIISSSHHHIITAEYIIRHLVIF